MDSKVLAETAYNTVRGSLSPDNSIYGLEYKDLPEDIKEVCRLFTDEIRKIMYKRLTQ